MTPPTTPGRFTLWRCGCFTGQGDHVETERLCPTHAAAPAMLALIRKDAENFDDGIHGRRLRHNDMALSKERRALLATLEEG